MNLFRLDASIRTDGSHSREIADLVEEAWADGDVVTRRHVGTDPVPATAWGDVVSLAWTPEDARTERQHEALALAGREVDALVAADGLLFAVPLYNFGVSQHFKSWVDLVITDPRMAPGATPATAGRPAVLVTVRGGGYGAGTPARGLGPRHRLDAPDPRGRLAARPAGRRGRAHAGRHDPGHGGAARPGRRPPDPGRARGPRARPGTGPPSRRLTARTHRLSGADVVRATSAPDDVRAPGQWPPSGGRGTPGARPRSRPPG